MTTIPILLQVNRKKNIRKHQIPGVYIELVEELMFVDELFIDKGG